MKDLVRVIVGLLPEMHIVKVLRVLIAKHDHRIAMAIVGMRAPHLGGQFQIANRHVLEERHIRRTAVRRLVGALLLVLAIDLPRVGLLDRPLLGIHRLPAIGPLLEVFLEHDRQFFGPQAAADASQQRRLATSHAVLITRLHRISSLPRRFALVRPCGPLAPRADRYIILRTPFQLPSASVRLAPRTYFARAVHKLPNESPR